MLATSTADQNYGGVTGDPEHQLDYVTWFAQTVIHPMLDLEVSP